MKSIHIELQDLPERDQYSLRLLKAKAQFRKLFPGTSKQKPRYSEVMRSYYPELQEQRSELYNAFNDQKADWPILHKFEKLVFDTLPTE